jgi:hypothetical protein
VVPYRLLPRDEHKPARETDVKEGAGPAV